MNGATSPSTSTVAVNLPSRKVQTGVKKKCGTLCCVPGCTNDTRTNSNLSFHKFPKDLKLRKLWRDRINRQGKSGKFSLWAPTESSRICGMHFNFSGVKDYKEKIPRFFPWKSYEDDLFEMPKKVVKTSRTLKRKLVDELVSSEDIIICNLMEDALTLGYEVEIGRSIAGAGKKVMRLSAAGTRHDDNMKYVTENHDNSSSLLVNDHCYSTNSASMLEKNTIIEVLSEENLAFKNKILELEKTICDLEGSLHKKSVKVIELELQNQIKNAAKKTNFNIDTIQEDQQALFFYTGFDTKEKFQVFFKIVSQNYDEAIVNYKKQKLSSAASSAASKLKRKQIINPMNQLFLVLSRLRVGLLEADLAYRFGVSTSTIGFIWGFWLDHLVNTFDQIPIMPSRKADDEDMLMEFQGRFPTPRTVLDYADLFIENSSEFKVKSSNYASCRSCNTARGLIGIAPNGWISFVSDLTAGSMSDKEIMPKRLECNNSVMADPGFIIGDLLRPNIPTFLNGKEQLISLGEQNETREIADKSIHLERVIRQVKTFRILKYTLPNSLRDKSNKIWKICCYLCNFFVDQLLERSTTTTT